MHMSVWMSPRLCYIMTLQERNNNQYFICNLIGTGRLRLACLLMLSHSDRREWKRRRFMHEYYILNISVTCFIWFWLQTVRQLCEFWKVPLQLLFSSLFQGLWAEWGEHQMRAKRRRIRRRTKSQRTPKQPKSPKLTKKERRRTRRQQLQLYHRPPHVRTWQSSIMCSVCT